MVHMRTRIFSVLLTCAMLLSLLPATAMAADEDVAEINGTSYATLVDAVEAATSGQTVKLLTDTDISTAGLTIPNDKSLTLDLNGKTIKAASTETGRIRVYGALTIQDSTDAQKNGSGGGKIYTETDYNNSDTGYCVVASIGEDALVTLESGYIYAVRDNASSKGQFGLGVVQGGDVTITGGKVEAGWYAVSGNGTSNTQNSIINIEGGELISTADYAIYLPQSGTTNISGGIIYGAAGGVSVQRGTVNISGDALITSKGTGDTGDWGDGTGGQGCAALNVAANYDDCTVSISGGTLTAEQEAVVIATGTKYSADISITGGTFSSDVSEFVDSSSSITEQEDGSFVVGPLTAANAVASVGNTYYKTLIDAVNAAKTGDTVMLLQDFTHIGTPLITIPKNKGITLDLGGNTLTLKCAERFPDEGNNSELYGYSFVALINHGNLTIQNGTITWANAVSGIANTGHLLIASSARLMNSYESYSGHSLIANFGGVVTTAGSLVSTSNNGITTFGGSVEVSGGEILTKNSKASCIDFSNRNYDNASDHADVTISAGNLESGYFTISSNNLYSGGSNVTITGGTLTSDITTIYWPASGTLTLGSKDNTQGPTLTAKKGSVIEICSGTLNIYGGKLYGGTEYTSADSIATTEQWVKDFRTHAGAASGIGDAVTIIARRSGGYISAPLCVNITGGELESGQNYGVRYMDCNTPAEATKLEQDVFVSITGGSISGKIAAVDAQYVLPNEQNFISGGTFSSNPETYLATGYESVQDGESRWKVQPKADGGMAVTDTEVSDATVSATLEGVYTNASTTVADASASSSGASGENTNGALTVILPESSGVTTAALNIPQNTAASLSKASSLTLNSKDVGTVTLDAAALDAISKATSDVTIQITDNNGVYTVTAKAGSTNLLPASSSGTNGEVTISVPYTEPVNDGNKVVVYYIGDDGTLEAMDTTYASSTLTWTTNHLSSFAGVVIKPTDEVVYLPKNETLYSGALSTAIGAMEPAGGSITLVKDIENLQRGSTAVNNAVITLPAGTTFNGAGYTITAGTWDPSGEAHILGVSDCAGGEENKVVVKNLTIVGNATTKHGFNAYGDQNTPNVTLENVTIKNCGTAAVVVNHANVTAIDLTTSGNAWGAVNVDKSGNLNLQGNANNMAESVKIWTEANSSTTIDTADSNYAGFKPVTGVGTHLKGHIYYTDDVSDLGVAYNETTNTVYETLEAALTVAENGNTVAVVKNTNLNANATVNSGVTLVVNPGVTLTIPTGTTLTNSGTIQNNGTIIGTVETGTSGTPVKSTVTFSVTPSNATIVVTKNGSAISGTNGVYLLEDGTYSYTVSASGYYTQSGTFTVSGNAQTIAVSLRVIPTDSGSGSSTSGDYLITVDRTTGGKVTVNPGRADKGDTVTITVKPDSGYVLDELIVTAKDGGAVKLTWKDDNKYTFTMPGSQVSIEATFVKEGSQVVNTLPFTDVAESDWYYDAVQYVYENDLMNGTSTTAFSPFVTTSRAMILTILARYDGVDTSVGSTWYEAGAVWAIAEGVSDGTNLEANLTREQLVTMLWRYIGSPVVEGDLADYPDSASVSDWAVNAMIWAVDTGIITGNGAGALNPQGTATRAEVATILMRFIEN